MYIDLILSFDVLIISIQGLPAIFFMTSSQTESMYDSIWDAVFNAVPDWRDKVVSVCSDLERAQVNSARNKFPETTKICGCLFHYKQINISLISYG